MTRVVALALCAMLAACKKSDSAVGSDAAPAEVAVAASVRADPSVLPATAGSADEASQAGGSAQGGTTAEGAVEALRLPALKPPREHSAAAGGKVEIPGGKYPAGSTPGDDGRDPLSEPTLVNMDLTPFTIDALPYPGDVGSAPRTGASAAEAEAACKERSGRLCSEWEWERACRGPELDVYASGEQWDPTCEKEPAACTSGYGARAMGALRELTAGALRGATPLPADWKSEHGSHRCARRAPAADNTAGATFRCCYGAPQTPVKLPEVIEYPAFRSFKMDDAELGAIIAKTPELARIGEGVRFLTAENASQAYTRSDTSREGIKFTSAPILWSPERGVELVVLTGRSKYHSFVLAFYPLPGGAMRLASSMLFLRDVSPMVLAYRASSRRELLWTSFWGSRTDEGYVSWRDDNRVVIVQK